MPTKIMITTEHPIIKQLKESLKKTLHADLDSVQGIRIYDFALLAEAFDIDFKTEHEEPDFELIEEQIHACLKEYQITLFLHNIRYIAFDDEAAVTYETTLFGENAFSETEAALLKQFAQFAHVSEDTLQAFLTSQTKTVTCIQDLLNMNVDELKHWHDTLGVPDNIRDFIDAHFFADRYATFSLRDIVEKIEDLIEYDEIENILTYEQGLLKDIMEHRFGSMKYDW